MTTLPYRKPRLPSNYHIWFEPPDDTGEEMLHFVSERRRLTLKGHSFREFQQLVLPLLDGQHTFEELCREVVDVFRPEDLQAALQLLATHHLLDEGDPSLAESLTRRLTPQLNFFHEFAGGTAERQTRLGQATVTLLGLGGAGAATALSLAAAGVGALRCVDALPVQETDVYLSPLFRMEHVSRNRAAVVAQMVTASASQVKALVHDQPMTSEEDVLAAITGSRFVINCLDAGQANLVFKLNRVCLAAGIPWTSCALSGTEIILGPTIHPFAGPCYLCYRMRVVACAGNAEDAFAYERYLDQRKQDDSGRRENLVFGAGLAANLVGLEALKELTGMAEPAAYGRVAILNLWDLTLSKHVVLRKPWCPACYPKTPSTEKPTPEPASAA